MVIRRSHLILVLPVAALILRFISGPGAGLSYMLLAFYALYGRPQVVQALALSWFFTMLSPGVAPVPLAASIGRYIVFAAAVLSVLLRFNDSKRSSASPKVFYMSSLLGCYLVIHSLLFSIVSEISLLKAISWTVVALTLLAAWGKLSDDERAVLEKQLFGGLIVLVLVSWPFALSPIGYLTNGTGFQGILNQPQAFGPVVALLGGWLAGRLLGSAKPKWHEVALLFLCFLLILMSEARTAGFAMVLGVVVAITTSSKLSGIPVRKLLPGLRSKRLWGVVFVIIVGLVASPSAVSERLEGYLTKRTDVGSLLEAADASRGRLVDAMIKNIDENPFAGIGFGVASDPVEMVVDRDPVFGLPTGAAVEKGVLPIAVIEELGVPGAILVLIWLWVVVRRAAQSGIYAITVLAIIIFSNFGEATLFSPGGMGLLSLVLLSWVATGKRLNSARHVYA